MAEDKKKLLFVITQGVVGGAQKYVFDLAKHFKSSHEVVVVMGGSNGEYLFGALKRENIKTIHIKNLKRNVSFLGDLKTFFELIEIFKKEKPDLIHLNSSKVGLIGSLAAFFHKLITNNYKLKTVFTAHGWIFKEDLPRWTWWVAVLVARLAAKFQDRIICVSRDDFNQALKNKIAPPRKLYVIHNAIVDTQFLFRKNAREEIRKMIGRELPDNVFLIANLGRLYTNKGLNYLIEAVKELKTKFPAPSFKLQDLALVIFGDGPERETLKLQITNYKLQNSVFLVGDVADVAKYLPAFDALVLSSVKEGFPYAILEAGLAGVSVVATNIGGVGEAISNGETGILVEPKNSKALADAILKLEGNRELAKKLSSQLKKSVSKNFDFETMIQKTEWVYKV